jgi:hypothetical protein
MASKSKICGGKSMTTKRAFEMCCGKSTAMERVFEKCGERPYIEVYLSSSTNFGI